MPVDLLDVERGAEEASAAHEEVWRAHHTALATLPPVHQDRFPDIQIRPDQASERGDLVQHQSVADVSSVLEEGVTQSQADPLTLDRPDAVGVRRDRQRRWGRPWEPARIEPAEQIWRDLGAERVDLLGDARSLQRLPVDELERPRPDPEDEVIPALVAPAPDEVPETDVGERAADVREDLDLRHASMVRR